MSKPIEDVLIEIYKDNTLVKWCKTGVNGKCSVRLPKGTYRLKASKTGYEPHEQTVTIIGDKFKTVYLSPITGAYIHTLAGTTFSDYMALQARIPPQMLVTNAKTRLSDEYLLSFPSPNPSGLDPNDPLWMPSGGWSEVVDFSSPDDLNSFEHYNAVVEDGLCKLAPPIGSNSGSYIKRQTDTKCYTRIAICFKYIENVANTSTQFTIINTYSFCNHSGCGVKLEHHLQPPYTKVVDTATGYENNIGDRREKWLVLVFSLCNCKVYEGTTLIHEQGVTTQTDPPNAPLPPDRYMLRCNGTDSADYNIWTYIDWIAFRYG